MISRECFIIRGALNSMELRFESITQLSGRQEVKRIQAGATSWRCAAGGWWTSGGEIKEVCLQSWEAGYARRMGNIVGKEEGCGLNLWQRRGWSRSLVPVLEVHRRLIVSRWDWWCGKRNSEVVRGGQKANEKERYGLMMDIQWHAQSFKALHQD